METDISLRQFLQDARRNPELATFLQSAVSTYADPAAPDADASEGAALPSPPASLDEQTAWELVSLIRRVTGFPRLEPHRPAGDEGFWTMPPSIHAALYDLGKRSSRASQLWQAALATPAQAVLGNPLAEDVYAAAARDGLHLSYERVRSLVAAGATPLGGEERVVANAVRLIDDLAEQRVALGRGNYRGVYQALVRGTGLPSPTTSLRGPAPSPASGRTAAPLLGILPDEVPAATGSFAPSLLKSLQRWGAHPLFGLLMHSEAVWTYEPFPACNGLIELVSRHVAAHRIDMPALTLIPLAKKRQAWEHETARGVPSNFPLGRAAILSGFGVDCTPALLQLVNFITESLEDIEQRLIAAQQEKEQRKQEASRDFRLNHRQARLVHAMIDEPGLRTDVASYRKRFDVALTTARDDLNRLVDLQYCATAYEGKRQVFWSM